MAIPSFPDVRGIVHFLVDTGADSTLLAPRDALELRIDLARLPANSASTGIGGRTPTVCVEAVLTLDTLTFPIALRILAPVGRRQQEALSFIPSLLGRDILSRFALFLEERTNRVLLLEPSEADALALS
ncbi:MAG: retropepsin-like domain-containing protein [Chloroflexi bacterium]|nr:retropepsin-like domain-containing protein [Chloroflexota bacterium]